MRRCALLALLALAACSSTAPTPDTPPTEIQCRDAAGQKIPCP